MKNRRNFLKGLTAFAFVPIVSTKVVASPLEVKTYFVDGICGDDKNDGVTKPWRTPNAFGKINEKIN